MIIALVYHLGLQCESKRAREQESKRERERKRTKIVGIFKTQQPRCQEIIGLLNYGNRCGCNGITPAAAAAAAAAADREKISSASGSENNFLLSLFPTVLFFVFPRAICASLFFHSRTTPSFCFSKVFATSMAVYVREPHNTRERARVRAKSTLYRYTNQARLAPKIRTRIPLPLPLVP